MWKTHVFAHKTCGFFYPQNIVFNMENMCAACETITNKFLEENTESVRVGSISYDSNTESSIENNILTDKSSSKEVSDEKLICLAYFWLFVFQHVRSSKRK